MRGVIMNNNQNVAEAINLLFNPTSFQEAIQIEDETDCDITAGLDWGLAIPIMYLRMGHSLEEIAGKYQLSLVSVHIAMAFYYEHRQEIDQQIVDAKAYAEAERLNSPSLLQEKLNAMKKYA